MAGCTGTAPRLRPWRQRRPSGTGEIWQRLAVVGRAVTSCAWARRPPARARPAQLLKKPPADLRGVVMTQAPRQRARPSRPLRQALGVQGGKAAAFQRDRRSRGVRRNIGQIDAGLGAGADRCGPFRTDRGCDRYGDTPSDELVRVQLPEADASASDLRATAMNRPPTGSTARSSKPPGPTRRASTWRRIRRSRREKTLL